MTTPSPEDLATLAPTIVHVPDVAPAYAPTAYERVVKPTLDVLGALLLLVLLLPLMVVVAIGVRVSVGKGILYRQARVGQNGKPFVMYKFRSMGHDRRMGERRNPDRASSGSDRRRTHKHPEDPRVTGFGKFIRDYSIDELPQLFNVLKGDLSLVGPRPELVEIVERYEAWEHRRHVVKPGLTGLWQVTDRDDSGLMHLHVERDLEYISRLSFWTDTAILALTPAAVIFGARSDQTSRSTVHQTT